MVIIKDLEIKNCLSLSHVLLQFENNNYATIFNCSSLYKLKSKLIHAIKLFFCKKMVLLSMEGNPNTAIGYIRIKFLIPKEESEDNDVVDAMRLCQKPNTVFYYFNGKQYIDPIQVFHERCQIDVSSFYTFLNVDFVNENNNLMQNWISSKCPFRGSSGKSFELLADYLELSNSRPQFEQVRIAKLAQTNILIRRQCELLNRRTFVAIANEIGKIFNFITFQEYSVKFYIPLSGKNVNVHYMKWEDMDLNKVETFAKKTGQSDSCVWTRLEPGLKNLLNISRMIAFAIHLKQKFVFIEDTTLLQEYQNQEMIKEAILQIDEDKHADWYNKNFIKQIVDVCKEMKIMIFMNYHGGLPLPPENANIIKCRDFSETDGHSIYVCSDLKPETLIDFVTPFMPPNTTS